MNRHTIQRIFLLLLVVFISLIFILMIKSFLMAMLLAGIFSALLHPVYRQLSGWMGGRETAAGVITILGVILIVLLPLSGFLGIVTSQAIKVGQLAKPWVQEQLTSQDTISGWLSHIPFYETIAPYQETILQKAGEIAEAASGMFLNGLQAFTMGTVNFILMFFIFLYATFFFLLDGSKLLDKMLYYMPLEDGDEQRILEKFTSVTRATVKGTAVIGILQGGLSGIALALVGIPSAVFWGTVMTLLSIIPGIGTALVWVPAAIVLLIKGLWAKAIFLVVFCGLVVGSVDNLLRPRIVGKDTEMPDLLILFSTLGGLSLFGIAGFIIGPIIAALFVTIWDMYGIAFRDFLPETGQLLLHKKTEDYEIIDEETDATVEASDSAEFQ
jgi:predicted PurR-regulated permease PerM